MQVFGKIFSFFFSKSVRNLALTYAEVKNGIFIQGVSGKLYAYSTWSNQETANGVAVLTDKCSFVIAPEVIDYGFYATSMNPPLNQLSYEQAINDYDGEGNTKKLINYIKENSYYSDLIQLTAEYVFPNGKTGYMGSVGEWVVVSDNINEICDALDLIGVSVDFYDLRNFTMWTSSRCPNNSNGMWLWRVGVSYGVTDSNEWGTSVTNSMPLQAL